MSYLGTFPHNLSGKQPVEKQRIILWQEGGVTEKPAIFDTFLLQFLVFLVFEDLHRRTHVIQLHVE